MLVSTRNIDSGIVAAVEGRLDTVNAADFQSKIEQLLPSKPKNLYLDFSKLEYISTAGLRAVLVIAKKSSAAGAKACCFDLQPLVKRVFEISEFSRLVPIFDTLDQATEGR